MKRRAFVSTALLPLAAPLAAAPAAKRMVVVISLDGFPSYALDDAQLPIPTIRRLAREGASAQAMLPINPTVTWPNHTAMVTGCDASRHLLLYNGILSRSSAGAPYRVEPWREKDAMVHRPTLYDLAHARGLTTAQVDWVAIYRAKTINWEFPEIPNPNGAIEKELIARGVVTHDELATFRRASIVWRDRIWTEAAVHILRERQPDLTLFHLLDTDSTHHRYGPMSLASYNALAFVDDRVKQIYDALEKAGLLDRATLLVVSDHGFRRVKHVIQARAVLKEKGLLAPDGPAWLIPEGGSAMIYITDPARRAEAVARVREALGAVEGVDGVFGPEDFGKLGLPTPAESDQGPDLALSAKPDYAIGGRSEGPVITPSDSGSHGYLNSDPEMKAIFVAWGAGIRAGARLGEISMMDVGPTAAALLGFRMENVQGRALEEILK